MPTVTTPTALEGLGLLVAVPVAMVAHEAAHYVVAAVSGAAPRWHASVTESMRVTYDTPERRVVAVAILLAPLWSGVVSGALAVAIWGWPGASYFEAAAVLGWLFYTIRESGQDVRAVVGSLEPWREDFLKALSILSLASLLLVSPYGQAAPVRWLVLYPAIIAACVLGGLSEWDRPEPA